LKKINQIQPWINHEEANYVKKIISKTYLTENIETKKFEDYKNYYYKDLPTKNIEEALEFIKKTR